MAKHVDHKSGHDSKVEQAFHEVKHNEPAVVAETREKKGEEAAEKQKVAIALSKARAAGADIPEKPHGSGAFSEEDLARGYKVV